MYTNGPESLARTLQELTAIVQPEEALATRKSHKKLAIHRGYLN